MSATLETDDMLRLQSDVAGALASCDLFDPVHVVERRKLRLQSELEFVAFLTGKRAGADGRAGAMVSVDMPVFTVPDPNISGPQKLVVMTLTVLEHDAVNMGTSGTQVPAETWANLALDFLHHWMPRAGVAITAADTAIAPAGEFKQLIGYTVAVRLPRFRSAFARVKQATISVATGTATITNHSDNSDAVVWYTTDGSYPADKNRLPAATSVHYTAPFAVVAGQEVRWAAYKAGMFPSSVGSHSVT